MKYHIKLRIIERNIIREHEGAFLNLRFPGIQVNNSVWIGIISYQIR
jgi:hypothetical protein